MIKSSKESEATGKLSPKVLKDIVVEKHKSDRNFHKKQRKSWRIEEHTKIFASMCPDEILDYYDDYSSRTYQTTLMLGDVSGFTELAEKYTYSDKGGPSKLTETLNSYIGAMVQEILFHNGDVLKFSGDAFVVMWKMQNSKTMKDVATEAIQTACVIQKHFGTHETDVGVTLKVKLAIASGKTTFTSIGDPQKTSYYIITGKPVWDVKSAEALCRGGDILVAPSCWRWANPNEFIHESLPDGVHTLITGSSIMWEEPKERYELEPNYSKIQQSTSLFQNYSTFLPGNSDRPIAKKNIEELNNVPPFTDTNDYRHIQMKQVDYSLRPKVIKVAKQLLKDELRSYMLPPVVRSVENDEPIEYLTEMRQVVIVFVNVITSNVDKKRLILIVDAAYKLVCGIVGEMQGCVNKTSLFDKDLMFLCIFGLRGDKHELESQIGLKCASQIRRSLTAMRSMKSVTVGVTTGITYCGVVGHILRREYTVIGMPVNKAARLMCVYTDKVICDRDSFLQSRLDAKHFILQEPKFLKGITNVGPVYEFLEQPQGDPRMGKSRLLDAMIQTIPSDIRYNHIILQTSDYQMPYTLIHLIFSAPLGFGSISLTSKIREDKLISRLGKIRQPHYLCALNQAFNVNFTTTRRYQALDESEKRKVLRKFIAKLTHRCFHHLWVLLIDDAEFTDPESASLLATIVKQNRVLLVLNFGQKIVVDWKLDSAIVEKATVIELAGIDKWFHAALACQILNVIAIPPELEKVIQERSMGNPGWIESYLVSLVQAGGIVIKKKKMKSLRGMGYVIPPEIMINSTSAYDQDPNAESGILKDRKDGWNMYRMSFAESASTVAEQSEPGQRETKEANIVGTKNERRVTICSIPQEFDLEDVHTEMTMDVMILKLFDSLTPLAQFLLKCASVLGETFDRNMLEKLMEGTTGREIGLAVTKLFEIRILGCAVGDFTRSPGPLMFFRPSRKQNMDIEIRCGCSGLTIRESLMDLPKYASCGLMRFKMSMFRDTTYRLLTDNQKVHFHTEALKYLRQNTRRCDSCGGGQFARLIGRIYPQSMKSVKRKVNSLYNITNLLEYDDKFESIVMKSNEQRSSASESGETSCMSFYRKKVKWPARTFSNFDFTNCQCNIILSTVYSQLLEHYRGIDRKDKMLTAILEFVEVLLAASNVPQARKLLNEAEKILAEMFGHGQDDELITLPYLTGKIKTLQGRCNVATGSIDEADRLLNEAIKSLGWNFPRTSIMARWRSRILVEEQRLILTCLRDWKVGVAKGDAANYNDQLADCLAQMFIVFRMRGMQEHARLAAIWGLNAAVSSNKDFIALCTAYGNMIITANNFQCRSIIQILENDAMNVCGRKTGDLELQDLRAVADLYSKIFVSRWLKGETTKASSLGFIALRIVRSIGSVALRITILPKLIHLLMVECRHGEVVTLLRELEIVSMNDMDRSGRTWYYALCMDFQLETGVTIVPFRKCEEYYQEEGETMINLRDPEAENSYFTSMWLWCIRMKEWDAATVWRSRQRKIADKTDNHTVEGSISVLRKLEGLLIQYVHKLEKRNATAQEMILTDIHKQFKIVKKLLNVVRVILPRYILMKSYYNMVRFRTQAGMRLLKRSMKIAAKMNNKLINKWADHCEKAWIGSLSVVHRDFWKESCNTVSRVSWHMMGEKFGKLIPYSLPLPLPQNF